MKISTIAAACLLATVAAGAQAASTIEVYAPPSNFPALGLSAAGQSGVSYGAQGNVYLPAPNGTWTSIGGNSVYAGFGGSLGISANGSTISGDATGANGYSQAATYSTATGTWTTLGSLGYHSTTAIGGVQQQSSAVAISADGSTVVGSAYFNTSGTTASASHPVVFRNGQVYDLNASGTASQGGSALASNGNGTVVGGYVSNSSIGTIWTWNGSAYVGSNPTINNSKGVAEGIQAAAISNSGTWVAGGSVNLLATNYGTLGSPVTFSQATLWNTQTSSGMLIPFDHTIDTSVTSTDIDKNMKTSVAGVSDTGLVIGSFTTSVNGTTGLLASDAWIFNEATGKSQTFDSFLSSLGLGLTATEHVWNLYSMSAEGTSISGVFYDSATSLSSSFVLHLDSDSIGVSAVPEPTSLALLALGLPLLLRGLSKRRSIA